MSLLTVPHCLDPKRGDGRRRVRLEEGEKEERGGEGKRKERKGRYKRKKRKKGKIFTK